jgi:hypothetical protein
VPRKDVTGRLGELEKGFRTVVTCALFGLCGCDLDGLIKFPNRPKCSWVHSMPWYHTKVEPQVVFHTVLYFEI